MFGFIKKGLQKTVDAIAAVLPEKKAAVSKDELESILLEADVEYDLVEIILRELYQNEVTREQLESKLLATLSFAQNTLSDNPDKPTVTLIIGVNGAGKTTTIAKLAQRHLNNGERVILGAGDTFRAAAIEQLTLWAERVDVPIIHQKSGSDPSAVAFDAMDAAVSRDMDVVIVDTAGRMHTKVNLMDEVKKVKPDP